MEKGYRNGREWAVNVFESWPEIPESLYIYRRAFAELQTARPIGMSGACAIPWTAIDAWARRFGICDPDEFVDLHMMIRAQDDAWLEAAREQKGNSSGKDNDEQVSF